MKRTTTTVTGIAALIGATLMITTPTPTSAASPTRTDLCLAIDDEPMCDVVHSTPTSDPPPETRSAETSPGCVRIDHVHACVA